MMLVKVFPVVTLKYPGTCRQHLAAEAMHVMPMALERAEFGKTVNIITARMRTLPYSGSIIDRSQARKLKREAGAKVREAFGGAAWFTLARPAPERMARAGRGEGGGGFAIGCFGPRCNRNMQRPQGRPMRLKISTWMISPRPQPCRVVLEFRWRRLS